MPLHFPSSLAPSASAAYSSPPAPAEAKPVVAVSDAPIGPAGADTSDIDEAQAQFEAMEALEEVVTDEIKQTVESRRATAQARVVRRQEVERIYDERDKEAQRDIRDPFQPFKK